MKKISKAKIISTYASSLYQAAEQTGLVERVLKDTELLQDLLSQDKQIVSYLSNQVWAVDSKKAAVAEIAKKLKLSQEVTSCLEILAENGRMAELSGILAEFKHIYYRQHGIEEVEVLTVKALNAAQDKKLKTLLEKKLSKKVLLTYTIKPDLFGGLIVKYGSSMIDDSIQGKLTRLEIIMKGGQ